MLKGLSYAVAVLGQAEPGKADALKGGNVPLRVFGVAARDAVHAVVVFNGGAAADFVPHGFHAQTSVGIELADARRRAVGARPLKGLGKEPGRIAALKTVVLVLTLLTAWGASFAVRVLLKPHVPVLLEEAYLASLALVIALASVNAIKFAYQTISDIIIRIAVTSTTKRGSTVAPLIKRINTSTGTRELEVVFGLVSDASYVDNGGHKTDHLAGVVTD